MRPQPQNRGHGEDPGRIIYLGDVRRRRRAESTRLHDYQYIIAVVPVALVAWALFLTVALTVPPSKLLTYVAFFLPLWIALWATGCLAFYLGETLFIGPSDLGDSVRRGCLLALFAVVNLAALAAHHWSVALLGVSATAAVLVDLGRAHRLT